MSKDGRLGQEADRATPASPGAPTGLRHPGGIADADLFPDTLREEDVPAPTRGLDLRTEFLKERFNLPEAWVWHSFEAIESRPPFRFAKYSGGVYPFAKTRGKYKGCTDYKRPVPGSEAVVVLDDLEFNAWLPSWEARTGLCHQCRGTGQEWRGWNHKEGNKYRDCPRCAATGSASAIEARQGPDPKGLDAQHESAAPAGGYAP